MGFCAQQRLDFTPQFFVAHARFSQKRIPLARLQVPRGLVERLDLLPPFWVHREIRSIHQNLIAVFARPIIAAQSGFAANRSAFEGA